ncbi:MAG: zinc ribbon domain-containing protein [Methanomassiliicoccales archaeon]
MADDGTILTIVVLIVLLVVVVYFELRYLRRKRNQGFDEDVAQDEAYNHILATKAASEAVSRQGKATYKADALLLRAEVEFKSGDYVKAEETVKAAKDALAQSVDKLLAPPPMREREKEPEAEQETVHAIKKLPKDYLEAKFMISKAADDVAEAQKEGRDVVEATKLLEGARAAFASEDYTMALKKSLNSSKWIGQKLPEEAPSKEAATETRTIIAEKPHLLEQLAERRCSCGNILSTDDNFCRRCGAKIPRPYDCPGCGDRVEPDDQFCRRCGKTLKDTRPCPGCGAALKPDATSCYACGASVPSQGNI